MELGSGSSEALGFVVAGIAAGLDATELAREFGPLGRFADSGSGEAILGLAADALTLARFTRDDPLDYQSIREQFLPEAEVSGKNENYKSDWTLRAVSTIAAGVDPGIADQLRFWRVMDLERWALNAVVAYVRAASDRRGVPVSEVCTAVAQENGLTLEL